MTNGIHHLHKMITRAELQAEAAKTEAVRRACLRVKWDCQMQLFFEEMAVRAPRLLSRRGTAFHRPTLNTLACAGASHTTCYRAAQWIVRLDVMPPIDHPFQKMWHSITSIAVCAEHRQQIERVGLEPEVLQVHKQIMESGCQYLERPLPDWSTLKLTFLAVAETPGMEWVGDRGRVVLAHDVCLDGARG